VAVGPRNAASLIQDLQPRRERGRRCAVNR
jgi:hypothetical protein